MKEIEENLQNLINDIKNNEDNNNNINFDNNCDLILTQLNSIFEKLNEYYNYSYEEISNYISFLTSFSSELSQINNIYKESQKYTNNSFNNYFCEKYKNYNSIIQEKFSDLSSQIQRSIISAIEIYKEKYKSENNILIYNFNQLMDKIKSENNYLIQIKKEYDEEKKNFDDEKNEEIKLKIKEKIEEKFELYKLKISEINLFLMDLKIEANKLFGDIINKQTTKEQSVKNSINNYFDIMDNFFSKTTNDITTFKNRLNEMDDSLKNSQFLKNIKFKIEDIKWEITNTNNNNGKKEKNKINDNKIILKENIPKNLTLDKSNNDYEESSNENKKTDKKNKSYKSQINKFISDLFKKEAFPENEAADFFMIISQDNINIELYNYICNCFYRQQKDEKRTIKEFFNFNNFTHFSNILNLMIENLTNNNSLHIQYDKYMILDKIINIGEECICDNTFICSLLNNNKKLKNETLWIMCITYKLIYELKDICESQYLSSINTKRKKLIGLGKHLLGKINIMDKNKNKDDDLIIKKGYYKFIPHYNDLNVKIKENISKNEMPKIMHNILKKYISHMANYNYPIEGSYKLIEGIYYEFFNRKKPELMNFYINYSIASTFSVRKIIPIPNLKKKVKSEELKLKIKEIKKHKYMVENKKYFSLENINNKYLILKNSIIFLTNSEKIKLINLNKDLYELLKKDIYQYILLNLKNSSFNIKEHIQIWKCFLRCSSIYKIAGIENTTYEAIIKEIQSNKEILNNHKNDINAIELDIPRSPFKQDIESSSKAIKNILYAFLYINKNEDIIYYQGMNYIVTFLYEMIHKEEDCFLLLAGLFYSSKYSDIFSKKMEKMQKYLYVVERLVYLYLPKISSHLRDNNLELNFFVNPIFISLFTNIYSSLPENDFSFLLEIWDDFIINGWKTIFIDVLAILKLNENKILNLKSEELIKYLSNGITNGEMFTIYNYDEFKKEKNKFQPTDQLLEILSKESILEKELDN